MVDINLKNYCSFLLPVTISGLYTVILCFREVLQILEIQQRKTQNLVYI